MFVSSYNTYVQTNNSNKVEKQRNEPQVLSNKSFTKHLSKEVPQENTRTSFLPVDYTSKGITSKNKQEIEKQLTQDKTSPKESISSFQNKKLLLNAQNAYTSNSKMFSIFALPQVPLSQTPSLEKTLPKEPMDIKESNMRHKMVNTYIANDNYFKITA